MDSKFREQSLGSFSLSSGNTHRNGHTCLWCAIALLFLIQVLTIFQSSEMIKPILRDIQDISNELDFLKDMLQRLSETRLRDKLKLSPPSFTDVHQTKLSESKPGEALSREKRDSNAQKSLKDGGQYLMSDNIRVNGTDGLQVPSVSVLSSATVREVCKSAVEFCPPSPPGSPGPKGLKGEFGEKGEKGFSGIPGRKGDPGRDGAKGSKGETGPRGPRGPPGMDGRDGLPGEPGLDGIPGRNGKDGSSGKDGIPGIPGRGGRDGTNGTDGIRGPHGPKGDLGPTGEKGLSGRPGTKGDKGDRGGDGIPGISAWVVNGTEGKQVLIPPEIIDLPKEITGPEVRSAKTGGNAMVLFEGENLRLECSAVGRPKPEISWMKRDRNPIRIGSWHASGVPGRYLNITKITRGHMGSYICIASNGVAPKAHKIFEVEIHFPPYIRIAHRMIGATPRSSAFLRCHVQAFPEPLIWWERAIDDKILPPGSKYQHLSQKRGGSPYDWDIMLNITAITSKDFGQYRCVAKNDEGVTKGIVTIIETDPRQVTPSPTKEEIAAYGTAPPEFADVEDICPPPPDCPECPKQRKCKDEDKGIAFSGVTATTLKGYQDFPYPKRNTECLLTQVGKPVFHRYTKALFGSWMMDSQPREPVSINSKKHWVTIDNNTNVLYEFENETSYRADSPSRIYPIPFPYQGNSHLVYNGTFYYHQRNEARLIGYHLENKHHFALNLTKMVYRDENFLYKNTHSYADFNVEENGLWVIYGLEPMNNTIVLKIRPHDLEIEYAWNISLNHHKVGDMFVVCGVLYAIDSLTERSTTIRFAYDLYQLKQLHEVELQFTNPFRANILVGYDPRRNALYSWDEGNQLTYPVKRSAMGYRMEDEDGPTTEALAEIKGPDGYSFAG